MKLIYCPSCKDVRRLFDDKPTVCRCGKSAGYYHNDGINATIIGESIPLGFANSSFVQALKHKDEIADAGYQFTAFIIPPNATTVHKEN